MAEESEILKILAQLAPGATTLTTLYTTPCQKRTQVHKLIICNRGAQATYRVAVIPLGEVLATKHYHYYDTVLAANASITIFDKNDPVYLYGHGFPDDVTPRVDLIKVYASTADLSFSLYGKEMFFNAGQ